eukprot:scaffold15550_cov34-Cyclotella_meneghiniana.AAC.2
MDVMRDCAPVVGWQLALCHDEKKSTQIVDGDVVVAYIDKYGRRCAFAFAVAGCGRLPVIAVGIAVVFR